MELTLVIIFFLQELLKQPPILQQVLSFSIIDFFITKVPRRMGMLVFNIICIGMGLLFFVKFGEIAQTIILGGCRFFNSISNIIQLMRWPSYQ